MPSARLMSATVRTFVDFAAAQLAAPDRNRGTSSFGQGFRGTD
jgi:hypothetical protein